MNRTSVPGGAKDARLGGPIDPWQVAVTLLGQDRVLVQHRSVVRAFGDRDAAAFFEQLTYWSTRTQDPSGWVHKTYAEWFEELFIPERTLRRIVSRLKADQLIDTEVHKINGAPTLHYRVTQTGIDFLCAALRREGNALLGEDFSPDAPDGTGQNGRNRTGQNGRNQSDKMAGTSYTKPTGIEYGKECVSPKRPKADPTPIHTHAETSKAIPLIQALSELCHEPKGTRDFNACLFYLNGEQATPEQIAGFVRWFGPVHLKRERADPPTSRQVHQLWPRYQEWQAKQGRTDAARERLSPQVEEIRRTSATETPEEREARLARNKAGWQKINQWLGKKEAGYAAG